MLSKLNILKTFQLEDATLKKSTSNGSTKPNKSGKAMFRKQKNDPQNCTNTFYFALIFYKNLLNIWL